MKRPLKYIFLCGLVVMGILYWTLAIISSWLMCDDSKAVENFTHDHLILITLPGAIWVADTFGGRYIVTAILIAIAWWVIKQKTQEPPTR